MGGWYLIIAMMLPLNPTTPYRVAAVGMSCTGAAAGEVSE